MKHNYRGHEIEVTRQPTITGDRLVFFSIVRLRDKYICADGFVADAERVNDVYKDCKLLVDEVLDDDGEWG